MLLDLNRPDMVIWDLGMEKLFVVEQYVPWDLNMVKKGWKYLGLLEDLRRQYPDFEVIMVVLIIGCLGTITSLGKELKKLVESEWEVRKLVQGMQRAVVCRSSVLLRSVEARCRKRVAFGSDAST